MLLLHGVLPAGTRTKLVGLVREQDVTKHVLQRLQTTFTDIDKAGEVVVPVANKVIQTNNRDDGGAQRNNHFEKISEVAKTVDLGRIMQILWNGCFEERPSDYQVPHAHRPRQDEHERVVQQAKGLEQQVVRYQTAGEIHGEGEQE